MTRKKQVESLLFLVHVARSIRPALEALTPPKTSAEIDFFYVQTVEVVPLLREAMYRRFPLITLSLSPIISAIQLVKWDTKELALRQSAWVDQAVARFSEFHVALEQMQNFLPPQLRPLLMRATILHLIEGVVEGLSRVRKIGPNAPLIMSNDLETLREHLEKYPGLKPLPFTSHLDKFIKAYFLPSDSPAAVLEWVRQHPDYTASQVMGLVTALMEGSKSTSLYLLKGNSSATKELLSQVQTAVQNNEPLSRRLSLSELAAWERGEIEVT